MAAPAIEGLDLPLGAANQEVVEGKTSAQRHHLEQVLVGDELVAHDLDFGDEHLFDKAEDHHDRSVGGQLGLGGDELELAEPVQPPHVAADGRRVVGITDRGAKLVADEHLVDPAQPENPNRRDRPIGEVADVLDARAPALDRRPEDQHARCREMVQSGESGSSTHRASILGGQRPNNPPGGLV